MHNEPDLTTLAALADKTLVMIVGPSSVGKSTIMNHLASLDPEFSYVRAFTTRPARVGEVSSYRHITDAEAAALHNAGQAITWLKHPTTGYVYGTEPASFTSPYNVLDTLSTAVEAYRALPFKSTITLSVTASPEHWQTWLDMRYPKGTGDLQKRLLEAKQSIEWSLAQHSHHAWLASTPGNAAENAQKVIDYSRNKLQLTATAPPQASALLNYVNNLLS